LESKKEGIRKKEKLFKTESDVGKEKETSEIQE